MLIYYKRAFTVLFQRVVFTMKEIELKVLDIDREQLEKKIVDLGAQKVFDGVVITQFYDFPDGSIQKAKDLIRLRLKGDAAFITYKRFIDRDDVKARDEFEVQVSDFDTADEILRGLGLNKTLRIMKERVSYRLDDVQFEFDRHLDEYAFIPDFLEIEGKAFGVVERYCELLGIAKNALKPWSFFDVADFYKKEL